MINALWMSWEDRVAPTADTSDVLALKRGDQDAFSTLMARYQNRLFRYLLRWVGDQAKAEDLFQVTWLRVIENINRFDPERNFAAWLFTVARNLAIDHLRRYQPEAVEDPERNGPTLLENHPPSLPEAYDRVLASERALLVQKALHSQPPFHREILSLRFEEEMKLREIAEVLGIPLSTVKSRLGRALQRLRSTYFAQQGEGEL